MKDPGLVSLGTMLDGCLVNTESCELISTDYMFF